MINKLILHKYQESNNNNNKVEANPIMMKNVSEARHKDEQLP